MEVRYAVPMLHRQEKMFDLIFADPPYEMGYVAATLKLLEARSLCRAHTVLLFEHSKREGWGRRRKKDMRCKPTDTATRW